MAISGVFGNSSGAVTTPTTRVIAYGAGTQGSCLTTKGINGWWSQVMPAIIPANSVGIGGYLDINYELSNSVTAGGTNMFFTTLSGITVGAAVSISAVGSYRGNIRIRNVDNSNLIATVANGDGNAIATNLFTMSADMTKDQQFVFWTNGGTPNSCIALKGWSIEARNISATATPAGLLPGRTIWYGLNHHFTYGSNPTNANIISAMKVLKMNTLRVDWYGISYSVTGIMNTTWITDLASAMQADGTGLNMCLLIGAGFGVSGVTFSDETAAYTYWKNQASYIAALVTPLGVQIFEEGNEMDASTLIRKSPVSAFQGTTLDDFSLGAASQWALMRGALRGVYDGVKGVAPNAMVGSNAFTNASIWAADALWNGTDPSGAKNQNQVRWDWTNWHLYSEGDATNVPYSGNTLNFNLLKYIHHAYGKPIMITEFNPAEATASTQVKVVTWLSSWYALQHTLNIAGVIFYDWFDAPYQYCNSNAAPSVPNSIGAAVTAFISANPALK